MPGRRERITFNRRTAKRIASVVTNAERGNRNMSPIRFRTAAGDDGGGGSEIRLGQISTTWSKGTTATVTRLNSDGSATTTPETFTAKNFFANVTVTSGSKKVACALVDVTWILIAAEC